MKKLIYSTLLSTSIVSANSEISVDIGKKDYENSKTKIDGTVYSLGTTHNYSNSKIELNYTNDNVNRKHPITKIELETLDVKKYNLNYRYNINKKFSVKTSYIKINDNIAPTDQGKIYGLGSTYKIDKGLGVSFDLYKSDYKTFDVNQYDISIYKNFKIKDTKLKATMIVKKIEIDGDNYASYTFKDKDYLTTQLKLNLNHNGFIAGIGTFIGKRTFAVLNDGNKVQHHAMQQDKTYMASIGKKFKNFDLVLKYSYQNGKELSENQDNVDTKVTSLMLKYKF